MVAGVTGHLVSSADLIEWSVATRERGLVDAHRAYRAWRREASVLGPASSPRLVVDVGAAALAHVLGFVSPAPDASGIILELSGAGIRLPCVVCAWASGMNRRWRDAALAARRLGSRWALVFNGTHLRLVDALRGPSRRWLEFDLDLAADAFDSFAVLWTLTRAEMFVAADRASATPLDRLIDQADSRAAGVCRSLRHGVLAAAGDVLAAILAGRDEYEPQAAFEQALTVVYRVLFLLFAESRGLVPTWHPIYQASYSIDAIRLAAERGRSVGLWDALRAISRLAHAGCRAGDLTVTPFNGRLFDVARAPLVERRDLDDEAARRAVLALTTSVSAPRGRERIAYRDLGVEQLGTVYETLLDYEPQARSVALSVSGRAGDRPHRIVSLERGSGARKATGSFYTPQPIARYLVRRTLGPLVAGRRPQDILSLKVLDPSMGSGAFLVAACRFIAESYEEAMVASGACLADDIGPEDRAAMHRLVAERCLFGVDSNPMAVQLARLSLWLATLSRDRPLSFLDHHMRTGDSLLGAWLSSLAHVRIPARRSRDTRTRPLFDEEGVRSVVKQVMPVRFALTGPNDSIDEVRAKERALAGLERPDSMLGRWKRVADLWCSQWLAATGGDRFTAYRTLADFVLTGKSALPGHVVAAQLDDCRRMVERHRLFHWELEFPEVFFDGNGQRLPAAGFDAVIGNPPWDMMRNDGAASGNRDCDRATLDRTLRFTRDAGVYNAQSGGHPNRYQLFLERSIDLLREGGRLGLVLPGGFGSDHGSAAMRRRLFSRCAVDGMVGFDNRRALFAIHRSVRFLLLTAAKGTPTTRFGIRLGEVDASVLEQPDSGDAQWFDLQLSVDLLRHLSGDSLALPNFRRSVDVAIAERAAALYPPLGSAAGWHARFGRELNATDDRDVLTASRGVPVVAGRLLEPFSVRVADASQMIRERDATKHLGDRWRRPRLAYRDVASPTNRITLIAALLPASCVSTHTVFCLMTRLPVRSQYFLCGLFNSFVVNYLVRLRVTSHVTTAIVERLPLPRRTDAPDAFREIAVLSHQLSRQSHAEARAEAIAGLNARIASLYQLSADEFAHVLSTFPLVDSAERDRALARFTRDWNGQRRVVSRQRRGPTGLL